MRSIRLIALVAWLFIASLAVAGFAAFSPQPAAPAAVPDPQQVAAASLIPSTGGEAAGRVAALALTNGLVEGPGGLADTDTHATIYAPYYESLGPDGSTTTTTAPPPARPTKTVAPPPTTARASTETAAPAAAPSPAANTIGPCPASWYGEYFRGRPTASGEPYNPDDITAAHKTLPLGTIATVTRVDTGASVTVRINDRGPYVGSRCVDLSRAAMEMVGGIGAGVVTVVINY